MQSISRKKLLTPLQAHQDKSWLQFSEQHPEFAEQLTGQVKGDFKQAIAVSDFILRSATQAPKLVIDLFTSQRVYQRKTPDYSALI